MGKFYSDRERLDYVKMWKISNLSQTQFAKKKGIPVATFRDWVHAYQNLEGQFIRINPDLSSPGNLINEPSLRMNMLASGEIVKKSTHFSRFDHSIVVLEVKDVKITSSVENAISILKRVFNYD